MFLNGKKILLSLALAFNCAVGIAAEKPSTPVRPESVDGLWEAKYIHVVVEIKNSTETPTVSFFWVDPADKRIYKNFATPEEANKKEGGLMTLWANKQEITAAEVSSLSGFSPKINVHAVTATKWEGSLEVRGKKMDVNIVVTKTDENTLDISASKYLLTHKEVWRRVQPGDPKFPQPLKATP